MIIPGDEVISRNIVGKLGDKVLWAISTIGGLNLVEARSSNGARSVIGAGSHRAVARMIAKRTNPDIEWTVLEKSSEIDPRDVEDILPFWQAVTLRVQEKLK
jgi:hypothetical protein